MDKEQNPLLRANARIPHSRALGIEFVTAGNGDATATMPGAEKILGDKRQGLLHSAALISLIDSVCGCAVFGGLKQYRPIATLDLRSDYLRPAVLGNTITARAECFRMTSQIAFVRASCWQDEERPIAQGAAAFMLGTRRGDRARDPSRKPADRADIPDSDPAALPDGCTPCPMRNWLERIPYAELLGVQMLRDAQGPLLRLPYKADLIGNMALPAIHGGVIAGFMENAALLRLIDETEAKRIPKPVDFSVDYLRSAGARDSFARCEIARLGRRVAQVQVKCWQDDPERPVALARCHFLLEDEVNGARGRT